MATAKNTTADTQQQADGTLPSPSPEPTLHPSSPSSQQFLNDGFAVDRYGGQAYTPDTTRLLDSIGSTDGMIQITKRFYQKFHQDKHLYRFLGGLQVPLDVHAKRLGSYIAEMMGAPSNPWQSDMKSRERCPIKLANGRSVVVVDRFSAHHCAWHSVDRESHKVGRRFKLDDCRVWMRLFFWAVRDSGFSDDSPMFRFLQKFVGHFIAIYEQTARAFVRLESRWSANPANIRRYNDSGNFMADVVDCEYRVALSAIPNEERMEGDRWMYDQAPILNF